MRNRLLSLALLPWFAVAAHAQEVEPLGDPGQDWSSSMEQVLTTNSLSATAALDPLAAPLLACSGTACRHLWLVALAPDDREDIRHLFEDVADSAQERRAIAQAIARIETSVGRQNGTWADDAGNRVSETDDPSQLDCVSETANTRSYLQRLVQAGLISRHHVGRMVMRFTLILQHVASTIVDDDDGNEYVVDSWVGANGEEPSVETLSQWRSHWRV
ncbi:MAG: hypothetical protein AB7G62_00385 [Magnetospirillum sp.]